MTSPLRIAVLLTCHERRETTLRCLARLRDQDTTAELIPVVVDAASSDGTAEAIRAAHPEATVEVVGNDVYWNRGMHRAWSIAQGLGVDAHVWLNDDSLLDADAVSRLVATWQGAANPQRVIVIGSTRDPDSGELTYGGVVRPSMIRPLKYELVEPIEPPATCETMNGNVVLIPSSVVKEIGILDPIYTHGMGDYEYGHVAGKAGIDLRITPGTVATCPRNAPEDPDMGLRDQFKAVRRPTGLPPADFATYSRRWAGPLWPIYWASPYVRRVLRKLRR